MRKQQIITIGYEGRTAQELLTVLRDNNIKTLLDVRRRPQSRKKGLSKTSLAAACSERELSYVHDAQLGTPAWQLEQTRKHGYSIEDLDVFRTYLLEQTEAMQAARNIVSQDRTALLCYERNHNDCHRIVVAQELASWLGVKTLHL